LSMLKPMQGSGNSHNETQSEDEAVAEDEAAYEDPNQTFIKVPNELVPTIRELIAKQFELTQNT